MTGKPELLQAVATAIMGRTATKGAESAIAAIEALGIPLQALAEGRMVAMPVEPTPQMVAAALPLAAVPQAVNDAAQEIARQAVRLLPPVSASKRRDGEMLAEQMVRDYRAMISSRPSVSVPEGGEG